MKKTNILKNEMKIEIVPIKGFININIKEIWQYRQLVLRFTWRDLKVRYRQTIFGVLWAILPPLFSMILFSVIFGTFLRVASDNIPYPIFVFTGLLIWNYFSASLNRCSNSLVAHQGIIKKVYFPRLILPLSSILSGLVDFVISFSVLIVLMIYFQFVPSLIGILLIPILLLITILTTLGLGIMFAAVNVRYRDIRVIVPYLLQVGFFLTPVIFPTSILESWSFLLWINPMTGVIESARAGLLSTGPINWSLLSISLIISLLLFIGSIYYFRWVEKDFVDII